MVNEDIKNKYKKQIRELKGKLTEAMTKEPRSMEELKSREELVNDLAEAMITIQKSKEANDEH